MEYQLSLLEKVCKEFAFKSCAKLNELLSGGRRLPPDLFLTALIGVVEDLIEEARIKELADIVKLLDEVRRDLEWSLREAVE